MGKNAPVKIIVNKQWCKKCGICIAYCPTGVYTADELGTPIISFLQKCINCQLCVLRCPDFAIVVEKIEKAKKE